VRRSFLSAELEHEDRGTHRPAPIHKVQRHRR
jgi:hypothetical protein